MADNNVTDDDLAALIALASEADRGVQPLHDFGMTRCLGHFGRRRADPIFFQGIRAMEEE